MVESYDARYDNMATPVPIVTKCGVGDDITDNLIPIHSEYKDNLTQEEYDAYDGGSTLKWQASSKFNHTASQ